MGGGIECKNSESIIKNNVIVRNEAGSGGGLSCSEGDDPIVVNNIFWENIPDEFYAVDDVSYCNVDGGWPGTGNIDVDPLFRDPANGDFHLMETYCGDPANSPCIDAGDPNILDIVLDCDWGLGTTISDMGAYGGGDSTMLVIEENEPPLPERHCLLQNYPNPFNAVTTIKYSLPTESEISLSIYNLLGQKIEMLFEGVQTPGEHMLTWETIHFPSGIYFARLEMAYRTENIKMVLLK